MYTSKITVYQYSKPAKGIKVSLEFWSGFSKNFYTDANGVAFVQHSSKGKATIYVKGMRKGKMNTPGQDVIYL